MTDFVLDNSVTMRWCFDKNSHPYADAVLQRLAAPPDRAFVPLLWRYEVSAVLARAEKTKAIASQTAQEFLKTLAALPILVDAASADYVLSDVHRLAVTYGLTAYDAAYLELALRKSLAMAFGKTVTTRRELEEAVATYTARAAEKLRRQHLACARLVVFVMTNRFRSQDAQYSREQAVQLPVATADTARLIAAAQRGLGAVWREGFRYKKAGVMLLDLAKASAVQGGLFDAPDNARAQARMRAVDLLNQRYGRDTVTFAATGTRRAWKLRSEFISPRYSTNWEDLLSV